MPASLTIAFLALAAVRASAAPAYVSPETCTPCHAEIARTYARTGMARTFSKALDVPKLDSYFHARSDRHYAIVERDGERFLRRHQRGYRGETTNVVERRIDYVIGSGNHARTFVSRTETGALVELPLSWYSGNGGYWAMSPGYDTPAHQDFRRRVSSNCLFCHNAYPAVPSATPQGIDCQRCHGPGAAHVQAASAGSPRAKVIDAIVNPARLSPERRLEVCLQCHLETTSRPLPNMLRRYERAPFSYIPGEPLGDYALHFDHPAGAGHDDKFEVNSAGYRFLKSRCFTASEGRFTCTTCHNPHDIQRGPPAAARFNNTCRQCHSSADTHAAASNDCISCHMPKRRAEDAVEVVMTDHWIRRKPSGPERLAPIDTVAAAEKAKYSGPVAPFYPKVEDPLYFAVAQVKDFTNLDRGIRMLESVLAKRQPGRAEFYLELAEAYRASGKLDRAIPLYEEARRRDLRLARAHAQLGESLLRLGKLPQAVAVLENGLAAIRDPEILLPLGVAYAQENRIVDSVRTLTEAARLNPDHAVTWLNLAVSLEHQGKPDEAENAYRTAIRVQPDFAPAHDRLARLLDALGDREQASYHRERARAATGRAKPQE